MLVTFKTDNDRILDRDLISCPCLTREFGQIFGVIPCHFYELFMRHKQTF